MASRLFLQALIVSGLAAWLVSCGGYPSISLGQTVSGTLTSSDNYWKETDEYGAVTSAGYSKDYQVDVVAGASYTVTFGTNTGNGNFVDDENGRFYWPDGSAGSALVLVPDNPQTVTWIPSKTGENKVDVEAGTDNVPLNYTILITKP